MDIRKNITFGWYQINQGIGYLAEHFNLNGRYEIRIQNNNSTDNCESKLISICFQSRHIKKNMMFIFNINLMLTHLKALPVGYVVAYQVDAPVDVALNLLMQF